MVRFRMRGTKWENSMVGTRILGKRSTTSTLPSTICLNGPIQPLDSKLKPYGIGTNQGTGAFRPDSLYGFGIPGQDQQAGIDRCFRNPELGTFVANWDAYGYNSDANPNNDRSVTGCLPVFHWYPWTHVAGFTTTYNDFDYTGAVFRLEQSWSTNEPRNFSFDPYGSQDAKHANSF